MFMKWFFISIFICFTTLFSQITDEFDFKQNLLSKNKLSPGESLTVTLPSDVTSWNIKLYSRKLKRVSRVNQAAASVIGLNTVITFPIPSNLSHGVIILLIDTNQFTKKVKIYVKSS